MNTSDTRHSVSVAGIVVRDDGRVLCIRRRDNGKWQPPGGVLELDEGIHEGLVREIFEETGVQVEPGPLTGVYKHMERGVVALVFRCGPTNGEPTATSEAAEVCWLSTAEAGEMMEEVFAVRLLDALGDGAPNIRAHDGVNLAHRICANEIEYFATE